MIVLRLDPLGRVEGGDGVIQGRDVADVRPYSSVTCPPDNLTQLDAIGCPVLQHWYGQREALR